MIIAFRRYTLLPLNDCLHALQPTIPHLTRSSLYRCLQRHGIGRLRIPTLSGQAFQLEAGHHSNQYPATLRG